jgi:signal transduction histidine kinase/ActR/RegA family two-component response regulator
MRLIDMHDYPPAARLAWFAMATSGGVVLAGAVVELAGMPVALQQRACFAAGLAALIGLFPVKVPGTKTSIAGAEIVIFLALLLYGPEAAILACALEGFVGSSRASKRWTSRIATPCINALSMAFAGGIFEYLRTLLEPGDSFLQTLTLAFGVALLYWAPSLTLCRLIFALKEGKPVTPIRWLPQHLWAALLYLASASIATVLYASHLAFGVETILATAPLIVMVMAALHFHFQRVQSDKLHVAELTASEQRLQEALRAAEQASRAKTQFLAAASHDLRQPLHALSFLTAALDLRPLDAPSRDIVAKMAKALEDLSLEFESLLDISKLDAGVVPCHPATFELLPFLRRVGEAFEPLARTRGIACSVSGDAHVHVRTDRALLERVVRNLADNAFKYTSQGYVRITCEAGTESVRIEVADTGIGIPPAEQERVFEEFYQVGNAERDRRRGMGLGLSIVRRLAQLLEVRLSMSSAPERGTTFTLELPLARCPAPEETPPPPEAIRLHDRQVLVIDDEAAPRDALRGYLEALGCRVSMAATTEEAAAIASMEEPDVVLADYRLRNEATGLHAIRRLREIHPGLRAIIVTGDTAPEQLAELDGCGLEVLYKPVAPARLVEALNAALEEEASVA